MVSYNMEPDYYGGQAPPVGLFPAPLVPTPLEIVCPVFKKIM